MKSIAALAAVLSLSACATGPVNTSNPSTSDLLFRWDELTQYLQSRRMELDGVQAQLRTVNAQLSTQLVALGQAQEEIDSLRRTNRANTRELAALEQETNALSAQTAEARTRLTALQNQKASLEARQISTSGQATTDAQDVSALRAEIAQLEQHVAVLQRAIDRTNESRRAQLLRAE